MLNSTFLACTQVEFWDLTVCIAVNREKIQSVTVIQCPISNLSELFSYTKYLNFMFLDQFPFFAKNPPHTETHTHTYGRKQRL